MICSSRAPPEDGKPRREELFLFVFVNFKVEWAEMRTELCLFAERQSRNSLLKINRGNLSRFLIKQKLGKKFLEIVCGCLKFEEVKQRSALLLPATLFTSSHKNSQKRFPIPFEADHKDLLAVLGILIVSTQSANAFEGFEMDSVSQLTSKKLCKR
jgi:hypothetical protein